MFNGDKMNYEIKISPNSVAQIIFILFILGLAYLIKDILVLVFAALILTSALGPAVDFLENRKIPRWFGIILIYFVFLFLVAILLQGFVEPLTKQTQAFIAGFPHFLEQVLITFNLTSFIDQNQLGQLIKDFISNFSSQLVSAPFVLAKIGADLFSGLMTFFSVLVITFYLILDIRKVKKFFSLLLVEEKRERFLRLINTSEKKLGGWLRGQLVLMASVGLMVFIGLILLGINFALPLAFLAGLLEIVPIIGPVSSTLPPLIIGLSESPLKGLGVIVLFIFVQQAENHLLVPQIMKGAVGLHPLVIILALLVGTKLLGPIGAILSVPVAVIVSVIFEEFLMKGEGKQ